MPALPVAAGARQEGVFPNSLAATSAIPGTREKPTGAPKKTGRHASGANTRARRGEESQALQKHVCVLEDMVRHLEHKILVLTQESARTTCAHAEIKAMLEDRINSLTADVVAAVHRATVAELASRIPSATVRPTNDTAPKKLPENQKLKSIKEMPAKKPCRIKRYGPKAVKTAVQPAAARRLVTVTGKKTTPSSSRAPIQTCKGNISGSKTMKKLKAPQVATPVSPRATAGGVGRVDGAAHWDWGPNDAAPTRDDEPSVYYV